jgi:glycosyltransferase involved in cell wall biosynthesis
MTMFATADETAPSVQFSLIMPAYNAAATLPVAIESLCAQTHVAFELIVVDDCSRDATAEIARDYAARDLRVRLITRTENTGASACRNVGALAARHKWVANIDADAVAPADWLSRAAVLATDANRSGWAAFGGGPGRAPSQCTAGAWARLGVSRQKRDAHFNPPAP